MNPYSNVKNKSGFTLLEFTVISLVVGILAAIAVPSYQGYMARLRQAEAKTSLGKIYVVLTKFRIHNKSFTSCLSDIGLKNDDTKYYTAGFNRLVMRTTETCGVNASRACNFKGYHTDPLVGSTFGEPCDDLSGVMLASSAAFGDIPNQENIAALFSDGTVTNLVSRDRFIAAAVGNVRPTFVFKKPQSLLNNNAYADDEPDPEIEEEEEGVIPDGVVPYGADYWIINEVKEITNIQRGL